MLTVEQAKAKILEGAEAVAEVEDMVTLYSAGQNPRRRHRLRN